MTLDAWQYGNPETVAIRKQEHESRQLKACGQCVHRVTVEFQGETYNGCKYKSRKFGTRCDLYQPKEGP